MKYLKILGLSAIASVALLAFAGAALATIVTSPAGTKLEKGALIKAKLLGQAVFHGEAFTITCNEASGEGKITDTGSATETTKGELFLGTFSGCNFPVTVLKTGNSEVHTSSGTANGNGTLTSTGAEVTVHGPFGINCLFKTSGTDIGEVTGGTPAKVDFNSALIPRTGDSAFCGAFAEMTGALEVTSPSSLFID